MAGVGLNEAEAERRGVAVEVTHVPLRESDPGIVESQAGLRDGAHPARQRPHPESHDREHAGELLAEVVLAMTWGLGLGKIIGTIHAYPTSAEANKDAAASWKKQRVPHRLLPWRRRG